MDSSALIYRKLEDFIRKFYTNELLRGIIFFTGLGLIYLLFTLFVEYFLWLKPAGRTLLFWLFILVEVFLLGRFILFPLSKLFRLNKGIGYEEASKIIGIHFSQVNDRLTNFLQLSNDTNKSELLLASIEQKASALQAVPFSNAINFNKNRKYIPLALLPLLLFGFFYISGNGTVISDSFARVVHFREQFTPPAPFKFVVLNDQLQTEQGSDFTLRVKTEGKLVPEDAMIFIGDESYTMENVAPGIFEYSFTKPASNIMFHVEANALHSPDYELSVVAVPAIVDLEMRVDFPSYLGRKSQLLKGTGNAVIPEGSRVTWNVRAVATSQVEWTDGSQQLPFALSQGSFRLGKSIIQNTEYQILTSNPKVRHYEKLSYQLSVTKDQFPVISVDHAPDSVSVSKNVLVGKVSDDYGLSRLQIVYYPKDTPSAAMQGGISVSRDVFDQFVFVFPANLPVKEGVSYEYYFEVFDNDAVHHYKSAKSSVFSDRIITQEEQQDQMFQEQNSTINSLETSVRNQDKQLNDLDKLQQLAKEKESLDFKDQKKVDDFIKRQQQQENMMKEFSQKLKKNLENFNPDKKDAVKDQLVDRIEKSEKMTEETKKLLDELKALNDKIKQEDLMEKMDQLKQDSKNQVKSLQQLVELTKRYYVQKKAEQLADKLNRLAAKQDKLSENEKENSAEKQDEINREFDKLQQDLKELDKENKELKSPMEIPKDEQKQKSIDEDQKEASEQLKQDNKAKAKPKQKSAAKKMKEMGASMSASMQSGEQEMMEEDVKMLRQILDNLLAYSFSQEDLMADFRNLKRNAPSYNKSLKIQQDLKQQFTHVDDSLFAMSLRNPKIVEDITKGVGDVHYNIDRSLDNLVEGNVVKGVSHEQYATSAANRLADMLSDVLSDMQAQLSGMGQGKPKSGQGDGGMQLPDIIMSQQQLADKMKKGMDKGKTPGEKPGDSQGKGQKPGQKPGDAGNKGNQGDGNEGDGQGEGNAGEVMKIYQEQRQLREALEKELQKKGMGGGGQQALDQMKEAEKQLLNKGFKNEALQKMFNAKQELLKLEKAIQQQGEEQKRQSTTSRKDFQNSVKALDPALQQYLNSIEILNRQALPLRPNYSKKTQEYFRKDD